jgi:hypothetical protein
MRVPKGTRNHGQGDADREWLLRAAESKARLEAAEMREWEALLTKAKAALASTEAVEWRALRERTDELGSRAAPPASTLAASAEEREWQELLARAKASAVVAVSATPGVTPPRARPPRRAPPAPRQMVVSWP